MTPITIYRRIQSQNKTSNRRGIGAQYEYKKERDTWFILIRAQLAPRAEPLPGKVRVKITSFRNRLLDAANLVGGAKPIPDILKRLNWIKDDAPRYFECAYEQRQVPVKDERTEIQIEDGA